MNLKRVVKSFLDQLPYVHRLSKQVEAQGFVPAGHYYSPIPSRKEVLSYVSSRKPPAATIPGINLNEEDQRSLLESYALFYPSLPFPEKKTPEYRYFYDNGWFSYSDAIFLSCFLRQHRPKKIVEVGSGFSSAVILDTVDGFFSERPEITFIEPYPDRLQSLLIEDDQRQVSLVAKKIQEADLDIFRSLQARDLLFIDSTHVVKCASDLHWIFFEIMPYLSPGVFVHFHDIFYPFDYPSEWLLEGRYWNESYFLRAFLSWNSEWKIRFFNTYVHFRFGDWIKERMPLCAKNTGGSLYIQRVEG